ncbi:Xylose import ATP-binding protein XylG [Serratia rubidaea]|uniref:Xylose import ATP-binding protein XylG n=1 Tax=Serratia rubidaea TaxID=61652 RepID=A0A4U9H816_SERRU|nr:Xylose import ATP-binding protein XylG [Serratia rubidaea]
MTVLENMFLGSEWSRHGLLDDDAMYQRCRRMLAQVKLAVDPDTRVGELGLGQQQLVEIAKALNKQVRLLVLDEPTASLTESETATLLTIVRDLRDRGIACIYISHKLNEVKAISDLICVIRDGKHIGTRPAAGMSEEEIIAMMVGRELTELYPQAQHAVGEVVLQVDNLTAWHPVNRHIRRVDDVSFTLRRGEILGVAGLVGSGRSETMQCLFGAYPGRWQGRITIDGQAVSIGNCRQAMRYGIAMVPEGPQTRRHRAGDGGRRQYDAGGAGGVQRPLSVLDEAREQAVIQQSLARLKVKTASAELAIGRLSGGNQQKAILRKCLLLNPKILILDEPTRGIDIARNMKSTN